MSVRSCFCSSIGSSTGILYDAVAKSHIVICRDLQESTGMDVWASDGATEGIQNTYHGRSASRIPSEKPIEVLKA